MRFPVKKDFTVSKKLKSIFNRTTASIRNGP